MPQVGSWSPMLQHSASVPSARVQILLALPDQPTPYNIPEEKKAEAFFSLESQNLQILEVVVSHIQGFQGFWIISKPKLPFGNVSFYIHKI